MSELTTSDGRTCNVLVMRGVEGPSVYLDDTRVAGNKPWGGGDIICAWTVPRADVLRALGIKEDV